MKKFILGGLAAAAVIVPIALTAGSASAAEVARQCQTAVVPTTATTAEFDTVQPAGAYGQWGNTWKHHYTVTVNPDGSFTGIGVQNGNDGWTELIDAPETISGTFTDGPDADAVSDQATFTATRTGAGVAYTLTNAWLGTGNIAVAAITLNQQPVVTEQPVEFLVSMPQFVTVTVDGEAEFANHGEYVTAMGGGKIAAQKCVGMPLTSNKNK